MSAPTPIELRATLLTLVAGATDTPTAKWEKLVGAVEALPIVFNPRCNWRVEVSGTGGDRDVLDKAVELLREAHPYVSAERSPGS